MHPCREGEVCAMAWGGVPLSRRALPDPPRCPERSPLLPGALPAHPPRDSWGGCKTPNDVCWELLQHARAIASLSPAPRTTGPASSGAAPVRGSGRCSGHAAFHPHLGGVFPLQSCTALKNSLMSEFVLDPQHVLGELERGGTQGKTLGKSCLVSTALCPWRVVLLELSWV